VALRLLRQFHDLFTEAMSRDLDESNNVLVALAKTPSIFPSDNRFGLREQLIYDSKFSKFEFYYVKLPPLQITTLRKYRLKNRVNYTLFP